MMKRTDSVIFLNRVRWYAYHGVMPQERTVGGWYEVSLRVHYDITAAAASDHVDDTLNYAVLLELVQREMNIPSNLLEQVAWRIGQAVFDNFPQSETVEISITKCNPPMGGDTAGAGVELCLVNDNRQTQ